jgi:peptidyl-prolyl cis-trans isomerase D
MFDLFRSRDKAVRIMLGGMLLLVALSMLTYLVPNYNTGSAASDVVIAEIGKETITLPDVQRLVQNTMKGRQLPAEILPNYVPQMIDQMITERALVLEAERIGLEVSDADVATTIRQLVPALFQDGRFVGKEAYAAMLAQEGLTIDQFEADLKRQVLVTRLRNIAMEGTVVTNAEIEAQFKKKNEKIKVEWVKLTPEKYKNEVAPSQQEIADYFKANTANYQVPEKKNLTLLIADQAKLEATVNPTDVELQKTYDQNKETFRTPERVKARHILLKTQGKPASEEAAIKAKAESLLKQIKSGGDFAKLARENSEDSGADGKSGSAANGGDLGDWITKGQMVPEFEKAIFSLKPGQTSDLVKTVYGYHIVQTLQRQEAGLRSFAEVKSDLASQWKKQRVNDLMQQASDNAQKAWLKDPSHPEKIAADFNMQVAKFDGYGPGSDVPEVGPSADLDQGVSTLKKGDISPAVTAGTKVVLAQVTDVIPAHPAKLEDVQAQIKDTISQRRFENALRQHASELIEKANAMGGDLAKAAKAMGLEVKTSPEVDRAGNIEGLGSASYVSEGFGKPVGSIIGPITTPDRATIVSKVIARSAPDMAALAAQRNTIRDEIKSQRARDRNMMFEAGVKDMLVKQGKIKIHQPVIDRLLASYRTS